MNNGYLTSCIVAFMISAGFRTAYASDSLPIGKLAFSGFGAMEMGQIVQGKHQQIDIAHVWEYSSILNAQLSKCINPFLNVYLGGECRLWYDQFPASMLRQDPAHVMSVYSTFIIDRADGVFSFGDDVSPRLSIDIGRFPYKYNPDVRNLGEYLFRSGLYPQFLIGDFDYPQARLSGFRISTTLFTTLCQDLLLTTETQVRPFFDFSLSYAGSYSVSDIVTLGWGGSLWRFLPVNGKMTKPAGTFDDMYVTAGGDTGYYTFSGAKVMGRFSVDPKRIFSRGESSGIFGKEDFRLYAEAAILGLGNYPASARVPHGYDTLGQKTVCMAGFNFPAFRVFDVLSIEAEWFGSKYPNSFQPGFYKDPLATPAQPSQTYSWHDYAIDDWKWSVYAKKTLFNAFSIIGEVARDHVRTTADNQWYVDREEALTRPGNWHWMVKTQFSF